METNREKEIIHSSMNPYYYYTTTNSNTTIFTHNLYKIYTIYTKYQIKRKREEETMKLQFVDLQVQFIFNNSI